MNDLAGMDLLPVEVLLYQVAPEKPLVMMQKEH